MAARKNWIKPGSCLEATSLREHLSVNQGRTGCAGSYHKLPPCMRTLTVAWRSSAVRARLGALLLPMWRPRGQGFRGLVGRWGELCAAMRWGKGRGGGGVSAGLDVSDWSCSVSRMVMREKGVGTLKGAGTRGGDAWWRGSEVRHQQPTTTHAVCDQRFLHSRFKALAVPCHGSRQRVCCCENLLRCCLCPP